MDGERDLVFLSYCHRDFGAAEAVRIMLGPALEGTGHALWTDSEDLRAGDRWRSGIDAAVARSRVAVVLVTKDYLASRFVRDHELPALLDHGVRIAPVLVGGCPWRKVAALADVQWLHDPAEDNALGLFTGAERDRRLNRIVERVLDLLPHDVPAPSSAGPSGPPSPAAPVPAGDRPGALDGVPGLPASYVERSDLLDGLVAALVERDAVGITGPGTGLYGQGGIGKSVLAAALARNGAVRARFPDGVHWVTVGEHADVLAVQLDLLRRLGDTDGPPQTTEDARTALAGLLRERRALLVVDDVWTTHAATAFRVTGPRGRVLFTTREPRVLDDVRARRHPVGVLSPADAGRLAARVLDQPPGELPAAAAAALSEVGHVALAVALLASAVRGGAGWDRISDELRAGADVYGDRPYANAFKAMQIAVARLPEDLARRLFDLAVFAADETIPVRAVGRLWATRHGDDAAATRRALGELARAALLTLDDGGVALHDLQHAFVELHGGDPVLRHATLLSGYRPLLGPGGRWSSLPPGEPYVWDRLVRHLRGAGEWRALAGTVTDPVFVARRIQAAGTHAAGADLAHAARALPDHPLIGWWRGWVARHAGLLDQAADDTDDDTDGCPVAPTVRAWLEADPDRPDGVDPGRLDPVLPRPHLTVRWGLVPPDRTLVRMLGGHDDEVSHLAWSPDGRCLASAGRDYRLQLVPRDGSAATVLDGDVSVSALAWSPDGDRLAVAERDTLTCWDVASGTVVLRVRLGHRAYALAWSPDGRTLAAAEGDMIEDICRDDEPEDDQVRLRDAGTGDVVATLAVGRVGNPWFSASLRLAWSPDGCLLAVADLYGEEIRMFGPSGDAVPPQDVGLTGEDLTLAGGVRSVTWSQDGTWFLAAGRARLLAWRRHGAVAISDHDTIGWQGSPSWSPDGTRFVVADVFGRMRIVQPADPDAGRTLGPGTGARLVAWSPDGTRVASAGADGQIRLWDPDAAFLPLLEDGDDRVVDDVRWAPGGAALSVCGPAYGRVEVREPRTGDVLVARRASAAAWSPDGTWLAVADESGVELWGLRTGTWRAPAIRLDDGAERVAWSADGAWLAVADGSGRCHLVRTRDDRITTVVQADGGLLPRHDRPPTIAWSPSGCRLAVGTRHETRIWEPHDRGPAARIRTDGMGATPQVWSPDGRRLTVQGPRSTMCIWTPDDGPESLRPVDGSSWAPPAWSPDGTRLACTSYGSATVHVVDTAGRTVATLDGGHRQRVAVVAWSPDGRRLATGGPDGRLNVWDDDGTGFARSAGLSVGSVGTVDWGPAGVAVGGPWGAAVLDLHDAGERTPNPPTTEPP